MLDRNGYTNMQRHNLMANKLCAYLINISEQLWQDFLGGGGMKKLLTSDTICFQVLLGCDVVYQKMQVIPLSPSPRSLQLVSLPVELRKNKWATQKVH